MRYFKTEKNELMICMHPYELCDLLSIADPERIDDEDQYRAYHEARDLWDDFRKSFNEGNYRWII